MNYRKFFLAKDIVGRVVDGLGGLGEPQVFKAGTEVKHRAILTDTRSHLVLKIDGQFKMVRAGILEAQDAFTCPGGHVVVRSAPQSDYLTVFPSVY